MTKARKIKSIKNKEDGKTEWDKIEDDPTIYLSTTPHFLTEDTLELWIAPTVKERDHVPPPTPDYNHVNFERETIESVPVNFPNLDMLKIPYIRKIGIKSCIELLGRFFNCNFYQTNQLQFWFLDVLTDCLWKVQDDFQLIEDDQKKVLEYFLYFFKIITDIRINYSRKRFLKTFKETILLIGDLIEEGCAVIPSPDKLFSLFDKDCDSEKSTVTCSSTVSNSENEEMEANIGIKMENAVHIFKLRNQIWANNLFDDISKASSFDRKKLPSDDDDSIILTDAIIEEKFEATEVDGNNTANSKATTSDAHSLTGHNMQEAYNITDFYQVDLRTPPRFLSSELALAHYRAMELEHMTDGIEEEGGDEYDHILEQASSSSVGQCDYNAQHITEERFDKSELSDISEYMSKSDPCKIAIVSSLTHKLKSKNDPATYKSIEGVVSAKRSTASASKVRVTATSSERKASSASISDTLLSSNTTIDRMIRAKRKAKLDKHLMPWQAYNLSEQRVLRQMADPDIGWPSLEENNNTELVDMTLQPMQPIAESVNTNMPVWQQLVHTTNNESEHSRNADQRKRMNIVITCAITDCVIEFLYDHFHFSLIKLAFQSTSYLVNQHVNSVWKSPKIPKADFTRPTPPKVKLPKIKKEKKSKSKSTKSSKKSSSKKSKSSRTKKSSEKSKKKKKSQTSSKSSKGVKLSKAEMDRIKKEKALLEEERRKNEEDKRFMFPLTDAATDQLFDNLFENWIKPKASKKKGKKERRDKKSKKSKK